MVTERRVVPDAEQLRGMFHGSVALPGDADYDEARSVWNGMIDRRPLAVVRVADLDDLRAGIALARDNALPLAIRGGGHNVAGNATVDDGIVLDLGALSSIEVDPATQTARVGPGARLNDVDRATEPFGLAVPIGVVSMTGIAGLTLGGGMGWLARKHGLSIDNLIAVDLMTASGDMVHASESENADLLWGVKGGGGNFGVVTSFTFRAHPLTQDVFTGTFVYNLPHWPDAMRAFRDWTADLDDRMTSIITFMIPPPEFEMGDEVLMFVGFIWAGDDHEEAARAAAPLRAAAAPDTEIVGTTRWVDWQSQFDSALPKGVRAVWKNAFFGPLTDDLIDALVEGCSQQVWLGTGVDLHHLGGAYGRVPEDATPFPNRAAPYWLNIYGFWADSDDDARDSAWIRGFHAAVAPFSTAGSYVNAITQDRGVSARDHALAIYGPAKLARLVELKRRYDPENLFRLNHNIPPD